MAVPSIPDGYHTITPSMRLRDCAKAIDFFKRVFGAQEKTRLAGPDGAIVHCELEIGDSRIMFGEALGEPVQVLQAMLYVRDCDAVFGRAVAAGATVLDPMADQFYGDRNGRVRDPFGNEWYIATHKEDVSPEEMERRFQAMAKGGKPG